MGILHTNPFTPDRILAATDDQELAYRGGQALAAINAAGIDPWRQPIDWALLLHCANATGAAVPLETMAERLMLLMAVSDPDGGGAAFFFNSRVTDPKMESRINLANSRGWVARNHPDEPGKGCNVSAAMESILAVIADERAVPELGRIRGLGGNAEPPTIVMHPYMVPIVVNDEPDHYGRVQDLFHLTSRVSIRWTIILGQEQLVPAYRELTKWRHNVHLVVASYNDTALTEDDTFAHVSEGLGEWYTAQADQGLIPA